MFTIKYDLQSFLDDLEELEKNKGLGNWDFFINDEEDCIELELKNDRFKDAGFFEVVENRHDLEFRFFFNERENTGEEEDISSFYYTMLFQFIRSKIIKDEDRIEFEND